MKSAKDIERLAKNIRIKRNAVSKDRILAGAQAALQESEKESTHSKQNIWRIIMKSPITKLTAAAVILIAVMLLINYPNTSIDGASTVFAAAIDHVKQARTFSCIPIFEMAYEDNGKEGKYLLKQQCMFIEPDLERNMTLTSPWPRYIGEVTITDYAARQRLEINPVEKTAVLSDISSEYAIDPKTGKLKQTQLNTNLRDRLLELTTGAIEDLGIVKLNDRSVRVLQSTKDNHAMTIWVDPDTYYPVQIEQKWTDNSRSPVLYTEIKIDTELNESLFSLESPEGYDLNVHKSGWSNEQRKISAKIRYLSLHCVMFASENDGQFPKELSELNQVGTTGQILKNVLISEDQPEGPAVIQYLAPRADTGSSPELILYETFDQWPESGIVAGFTDGHTEIISSQSRFEELIK